MSANVSAIRREAVEDLLATLFYHIDMNEYDQIGRLFKAAATFTFWFSRDDRQEGRPSTSLAGRDSIVLFFTQTFSGLAQTHHTFSNLAISAAPDGLKVSIHIRAYHKGKGASAHLLEESLAVADLVMNVSGGKPLIAVFNYTILIVLGSAEVFSASRHGPGPDSILP